MIAFGLARARHQLQNGTSRPGVQRYLPLDYQPAHLMRGKLAPTSSGQREAAMALGLIGLDEVNAWTSSVDNSRDARSGALRLTSTNATARIFLAANDDKITSLLECGAFDETDGDAVIICSGRVAERQQRSPSSDWRSGSIGPRYVPFGPILADAANLDDLRDRFRGDRPMSTSDRVVEILVEEGGCRTLLRSFKVGSQTFDFTHALGV